MEVLIVDVTFNKMTEINIKFDDYYSYDLWRMDEHPRFQELNEKQLKAFEKTQFKNINFESIKNKFIKKELKHFFIDLFDNRRLSFSTIISYAKVINAISGFVESYYIDTPSISVIQFDKAVLQYIDWLENNGYKTTLSYKNKINRNMNKVEYEYNSSYVRVFKSFYKYIVNSIDLDNRKEYDKDIWDVRNLDIKVTISESRARYTVNFEKIHQSKIKKVSKKFIYNRLKNKSVSTVLEDMKNINLFSEFISKKHPEIVSLRDLDRTIMEEYFAYVRSSVSYIGGVSKRIGGLKLFFETLQLMGIDEAPTKTLIVSKDYSKKDKTLPKYFSDNELKQINECIKELPLQVARMFFVIENVGMRISDLCSLKSDCLKQTGDIDYLLKYYQPKSKKWNTVPINEIVAKTIKEAISKSKEDFGEECKYVFAQSKNKAISSDTFSYHMNQMTFNNNILDDTGNVLRIKSHVFRGTVATQYANLGIDLNIIKMMLGQSSLGVLKHYVTIHDISMIECMKSITDDDNEYIANIGHVENIALNNGEYTQSTPLPNGICIKSIDSGKCPHANACYSCRMFKPSKKYLLLYKSQLQEAEQNIEIAKINGFERLLQINLDLKNDLIKIITSIEE